MTTVESARDEFLMGCQADGLSRSTVEWYRSMLGAFCQVHGAQHVQDMSTSDMRRYLVELRRHDYAYDTVSAHIRALHRFWKWTAAEYNISNPMRTIHYPKPKMPQPRAANLDDLVAMFQAAGDGAAGARNRAILAFLLDTGARAGGLLNLRVEDVDLKARRALVTEKGGKTRAITFTEATAGLLAEWMQHRAPIKPFFYNERTLEPLTRSGLYQMLRRLARRAGVKGRFNPHSLRHTFAREYIRAGGDLATLSRLLGHRDVSTTVNHYSVFTDAEIAEAHEKYSPARLLPGEGKTHLSG